MLCEQRDAGARAHAPASAAPRPGLAPIASAKPLTLLSTGACTAGAAPARATGAGAARFGAVAALGILACLPYELPALRAAPLDSDPLAASAPQGPQSPMSRSGAGAGQAPAWQTFQPGVWAGAVQGLELDIGVVAGRTRLADGDAGGAAVRGGAAYRPLMEYRARAGLGPWQEAALVATAQQGFLISGLSCPAWPPGWQPWACADADVPMSYIIGPFHLQNLATY